MKLANTHLHYHGNLLKLKALWLSGTEYLIILVGRY